MIVVFDIDGVLADATQRQHHVESRPKDWDAFFAAVAGDGLLEHGRARLWELQEEHEVVLLSGRPERTRADTEYWLEEQGIVASRLVLRPDDDRRPAGEFKAAAIRGIGAPEEIALVVDDDATVTDRLAALGYPTELFR